MSKLRAALERAMRNEARLMGILFGILTLAVILSGLFASPQLGTVDSGKYERIMKSAGLCHSERQQAEGDLLYVRVLESYDYAHFSYAKLFAPTRSGSILYPIALIRMLTRPFGLGFSTVYLFLLYAALAALGVYMIVRGVAFMWGRCGVIPGAVLLLLFADRNLTAYFGSLYETGTLIVALTLFCGCALRGFTYRRGCGFGAIWPVACASLLLLNASARAVIFAPAAAAATAGLAFREWESIRGGRRQIAALIALMLCAVYSSQGYFATDPDNFSNASAYHTVFQSILPASQNPEADLTELGLDASYLEDIGKSFYQDSGEYTHDPGDAAEAARLFSAMDAKKVALWELRHPVRFLRAVLHTAGDMNTLETGRVLGVGHSALSDEKVSRSNSLIGDLTKMLLPEGYGFFLFTAGVALSASIGLLVTRLVRRRDGKAAWIEPAVLIFLIAAAAGYLPLHIALMGPDSLELDRLVSVFCLIALWGGLLTVAGRAIRAGSVWFRRIYGEESPEQPEREVRARPRRRTLAFAEAARAIAHSRRNTVLAVLALALLMVCSIQFASPRAGTVNNGDYGRMMDHLGLTWTGEYYYDYGAQAGARVIEEFAFRDDFDPATLTSLKPRYSLVYPVSIARGICALFDLRFSTRYVSLVMSAALLMCILSIVRDLYAYFKGYTLLLGIGLCLAFLCESSLVWFNSLFGEGCILLGVMMVLACCVRLSVLPQGTGMAWVFALAFSGMFLITAKAQMMVALPVVSALVLMFAFYHRPLRIGRLILCALACLICVGLIGYKGIQIYNDNSHVSERQTVWQSVFYGALMVSDDPLGDMEELGLPPEMAADIGKDAYRPDGEYVISPNSDEAGEIMYDHINTFTMVGYYLRHPIRLMKMLEHTAGESQEMYNGFRAYLGQDYSGDHDAVDRWGFWLYWRPLFAFGHFWEYALAYGAALACALLQLRRGDLNAGKKMLVVSYLGIMLIGALQFPLTSIGNGFADNHKQLFGFLICHDLLVLLGMPALLLNLNERNLNSVFQKLRSVRWHKAE